MNRIKQMRKNSDEQISKKTNLQNVTSRSAAVVKSAVIVINMVSVQNLLAPFCCVLGEDTLRHFSCLVLLASNPVMPYKIKTLK